MGSWHLPLGSISVAAIEFTAGRGKIPGPTGLQLVFNTAATFLCGEAGSQNSTVAARVIPSSFAGIERKPAVVEYLLTPSEVADLCRCHQIGGDQPSPSNPVGIVNG